MPADALVTLGASVSAGMVLTPKSQNIPSPASEELRSAGVSHLVQQESTSSNQINGTSWWSPDREHLLHY